MYRFLTLDIETASDWNNTPASVRNACIKRHDRMRKSEKPEELAALSPYTGKVVCITLSVREGNGPRALHTWLLAPEGSDLTALQSKHPDYLSFFWTEREMLNHFMYQLVNLDPRQSAPPNSPQWDSSKDVYTVLTTFYGLRFDLPFLVQRALVNKVDSSSLLGRPYYHVDLADQLTLFGHTEPRMSLEAYCDWFGIESPKTGVIQGGSEVEAAYRNGQLADLIVYNRGDVVAADDLLQHTMQAGITNLQIPKSLWYVFKDRKNEAWPR